MPRNVRRPTPAGITPPAPGLDREEPELRREADIPADNGRASPSPEGSQAEKPGDDRPLQEVERE